MLSAGSSSRPSRQASRCVIAARFWHPIGLSELPSLPPGPKPILAVLHSRVLGMGRRVTLALGLAILLLASSGHAVPNLVM